MWLTQEDASTLATHEKVDVVRQFAAISPQGAVVFTGGEPFLKPEEVLALSKACRSLGLLSVVNTNGTTFCKEAIARLVSDGPRHLVFSLDGVAASTHDFVRGVSGTFDRAITAIQLVLTERARTHSDVKVSVSAILFEHNISSCISMVEFAKQLGVDGITFQMLSPTFYLSGKVDKFFQRYWFRDRDAAKLAIDELAAHYRDDPFLLLTPSDLAWMKTYIDDPNILPRSICGAGERNVVVDMHGEVQLCAYMRTLTNGATLGNVRRSSLRSVLTSEEAQAARDSMALCKRGCGMLNCNRRQKEG